MLVRKQSVETTNKSKNFLTSRNGLGKRLSRQKRKYVNKMLSVVDFTIPTFTIDLYPQLKEKKIEVEEQFDEDLKKIADDNY